MKEKPTESREGVKGGTSSLFISPLQGQGTASLVGFGATPQLFLVKPTQRKKSSKVAAAKRPAPKLRAPAGAPPKQLYPPSMLCRARWARPRCWACDHSCSFPNAGGFHAHDRSPCALWGAKSVLLMQSLAVLRRKERQLDAFDAVLYQMRLAKQRNMM